LPNSIYEDLPEDSEKAFIVLEEHFREECTDKIREAHHEERLDVYYMEYIGRVLAAIEELGLATAFLSPVPSIDEVNYTTYLNFSKDVEHYRTMLQIRHARRAQGFSIKFDHATKEKIKHHLNQIKEIVPKLEISESKRDDLMDKIVELEKEVDRDRTRLEVVGDFLSATTGMIGDAVEELEPIRRFIDSIAGLIWGARKEQKKLAPPERPKQIEPPKLDTKSRDNMNDDIPF
jgi:hypothetical protein